MVSQVVQVLDEGNQFMSPRRILKSPVKKFQRKRTPTRPPRTTGELDTFEKHKERDRKRAKDQHQKASLKWDNETNRWLVRQQENDEILRQTEQISEISLRTIGVVASLGLVKRWSSKATQGISKLKSLGARLRTASNEVERTKLHGEIVSVDAAVYEALKKMIIYSATLNTSGLIGLEKTLKNSIFKKTVYL